MSANGTQSSPGGSITRSVIRAPATAQEGEALTLIVYTVAAGRLKGTPWLVADSQSSGEALQASLESPKTHGMMRQIFSHVLGGRPLRSEACLQVLIHPSHRLSIINKGADRGCLLQPHLRGDRMFRRFFHYAPPEVTGEAFQLGPSQTKALLLSRHSATLAALHGAEFSDYCPFQLGRGIPMEWLTGPQQKHVQRQRISGISTMQEHHRRWGDRDFFWDPNCLICGLPDTCTHAWVCSGSASCVDQVTADLRDWLRMHWYRRRPTGHVLDESWDPECLVVWSMATKTTGFVDDRLSTATWDSLGTRFLADVVSASILLHAHRAEALERALRSKQGTSLTLQQFMQRAFRNAERGLPAENKDRSPAEEDGDNSETDDEG